MSNGRREFIALLGGTAGWPLAVRYQEYEAMTGLDAKPSKDGNPARKSSSSCT